MVRHLRVNLKLNIVHKEGASCIGCSSVVWTNDRAEPHQFCSVIGGSD